MTPNLVVDAKKPSLTGQLQTRTPSDSATTDRVAVDRAISSTAISSAANPVRSGGLAQEALAPRALEQSSGSYELVLAGVLLGLLGLWLDTKFGTTPWLMLGATMFGFIGAAVSLYYRYRHDLARLEAERDARRAHP